MHWYKSIMSNIKGGVKQSHIKVMFSNLVG